MPSPESAHHGTQPRLTSTGGHPLPRRTTPADSVTLRHHRHARHVPLRASLGAGPASNSIMTSSRRNSSGESHRTGCSDPMKWFDQSNENPSAALDNNAIDADPPFYQKESDSSNEDRACHFQHQAMSPRPTTGESSGADDYRSVIDDLTVEIQKLKEQLKRYKQRDPEMLRKDKLFEIKIHGLPRRKKRELETTLRDFAANLGDSPEASSSQRKKSSRHANRDHMYSGSGSISVSKHESSTSGSNAQPADSAYASMSTGDKSSGTFLGRPTVNSSRARSSDQKVENYLRDIPEGLYPRHVAMTEKEKKRLVVRRLEQLFTGKISGRHMRCRHGGEASSTTSVLPDELRQPVQQLSCQSGAELSREAKMLPREEQADRSRKKSTTTRDNGSVSNSNGDQTEPGGNGNTGGHGANTSLTSMPPPEDQRPTRPRDLDPNRVQVPSENMDYIRHLGLVPTELLSDKTLSAPDVCPDAEGWVYLNLLCNLAQLHMINVTPNFVHSAVSEISTKFQMSADGRKIRWQGGTEGTKFSSDSSGDNSQKSPDAYHTTSSHKSSPRKRQKTAADSLGDDLQLSSSRRNPSKFGPQVSMSLRSFHYKPLFVQQEALDGENSPAGTLSSFGPVEDSNLDDSPWEPSGSGATPNRRKRRRDGAIIYYSGAPFCTDLSGDPGESPSTAYMLSSDQNQQKLLAQSANSPPRQSESTLSLSYRPLSYIRPTSSSKMDVDCGDNMPELATDSEEVPEDLDFDMPWTSDQQYFEIRPLEPCGLGGVLPDDHFMVVVTTKRPKEDSSYDRREAGREQAGADQAANDIISRLATMRTSSPALPMARSPSLTNKPAMKIEYVSGRIKRLSPVPLPPPAIFLPPFSNDSSSDGDIEMKSENHNGNYESSEGDMSRRANPHLSDGYPDGEDLTSGDEDGEDPDDELDTHQMYDA